MSKGAGRIAGLGLRLLILAFTWALFAAHAQQTAEAAGGLSPACDWLGNGRIAFGYRLDAPPFSFAEPLLPTSAGCGAAQQREQKDKSELQDNNGRERIRQAICRPAGYSVEICRLIQDHLLQICPGTVVTWKPVTAGTRFEALRSGEIDLLCGTPTVSVARLREFDASLFTFLTGASFICTRDSKIAALKDMPNKRIGFLRDSTTESVLRRLLREANATGYALGSVPSYRCAFDLLRGSGKADDCKWRWDWGDTPPDDQRDTTTVDCFVGDRDILAYYYSNALKESKEHYFFEGTYHSLEPYAIFLRRDRSPELLYHVNLRLVQMFRRDPKFRDSIYSIFEDYFGSALMSDHLRKLFEVQRLPFE